MNLDELRDVRRTERQRDGLQHLRESFYRDVASYLADLKAERERAAERADDPFSDPEVRRLTDEIETAEDVVESLYERRVGKVVKRASFAAAGMSHDDGGLTDEERELFDDLVARIERNRERVLDAIDPDAATATGADGADGTDREAVADDRPTGEQSVDTPDPNDLLSEAMDGGTDAGSPVETDAETAGGEETPTADGGAPGDASPDTASDGPPAASPPTPGGGSVPGDADAASGRRDEDDRPGSSAGDPTRTDGTDRPDRTTVYVTREVGEIYGVDERTYSLDAEDVVDLPADNAEALVARDAAEPLE